MAFKEKLLELLRGYGKEEEHLLAIAEETLSNEEYRQLKKSVAKGESTITARTLDVPATTITYPAVSGEHEGASDALEEAAFEAAYESFSEKAFTALTQAIAPNIIDMPDVKEAAALQLFATERLHILLLGDPGTGKTEILRSSQHLAVHSAMGLGSGTSKAGLSVAYARGELHKGLLVRADGGVCCIDELNLMKKDDRAALYNAMEKGFVTYEKGGHHEEFSADVRVIATANPKGDRFVGEDVEKLKKQLPFDPALLSRFHLVFLIRKPDVEQFTEIAKKIVRNEKEKKIADEFYKSYIAHAHSLSVEFPDKLEPLVTDAARTIKEREDELLIEVSPRIVKGIMGFAKASARCELRSRVEENDVQRVLTILGQSLGITL